MPEKRFLILDDHEIYQTKVASILNRAFNDLNMPAPQIAYAANVREALQILKSQTFDGIIIDRGVTWESASQRHRDNIFDLDPASFPQSIKRKGVAPEFCDGIQEGNRQAFVMIATGLSGYAGRSMEGIDHVHEKGQPFPVRKILKAMNIPEDALARLAQD